MLCVPTTNMQNVASGYSDGDGDWAMTFMNLPGLLGVLKFQPPQQIVRVQKGDFPVNFQYSQG
jgi:hypothetical protein